MSAIFCDGFDTYSSLYDKWTLVTGSATPTETGITAARSRNGGQSARVDGFISNVSVSRAFGAASHATVLVHFAFYRGNSNNSRVGGVTLWSINNTTYQTSLTVNMTGTIEVNRGDYNGASIATSGVVVPQGTWAHIGWQVSLHDTAGASTVWVNGAQVLTFINNDTKASISGTTYDGMSLWGCRGNVTSQEGAHFDDIVVLNGAGSTNNTYLGDVQALALRANGAGDRTQLAPIGETANWENVDDTVHSGADYNASNVDGQGDLYAIQNLPASVGVHFVQQTSYVRKNLATAKSIAQILKVGGTEYPQTAVVLGTSFVPISNIYEVNPATSAGWTSDALNSAQAGVEVRP